MFRIVAILVATGLAAAMPAAAEALRPATEFTFKRVKVPDKGTAKRITVQIDPDAPVYSMYGPAPPAAPKPDLADTPAPSTGAVVAGTGFDWFWNDVSPSLDRAGAGRFAQALAVLDKAPPGQIAQPRLQDLKSIAQAHGTDILNATIGTQVSPALVLAMISVESGGRSDAISPAGAQGLMQLMPDTATRFGVDRPTDPGQSIKGGVAYMDWLLNQFGEDAVLALAGYNAGEGAVRQNAGVPPYAETRGYVPKVLAAWRVARGLCRTPPELPGDGCVFVLNADPLRG